MGIETTATGLGSMELACFFWLPDIDGDENGLTVIKYGSCGLGIGRVALSNRVWGVCLEFSGARMLAVYDFEEFEV